MLNPKIQDAFNHHLNQEFFSAYLYLSMASYLEARNLSGMAQWMRIQVQEELFHGSKFIDFVHERGGRVVLKAIEAPKIDWDSPLQVFEEAYQHECVISGMINKLVDLAIAESDHAANSFLQWFVNEQVEEEATVETIVNKLRMVGDNGVALFMLDNELGNRTAAPAPAGRISDRWWACAAPTHGDDGAGLAVALVPPYGCSACGCCRVGPAQCRPTTSHPSCRSISGPGSSSGC